MLVSTKTSDKFITYRSSLFFTLPYVTFGLAPPPFVDGSLAREVTEVELLLLLWIDVYLFCISI